MRRASLIIVTSLFSIFKVFGQYSYDGNSSEVIKLQRLYSEAGLAFPTISFPIFREDLSRYVDALIDRLPAGPLRESAQSFAASFMDREGIIITSNSNATYQPFIGFPEGPVTFGELLVMEKPFVEFSLGLQLDNSLQLVIRHMVHKKYSEGISANNFPTLIPGPALIRENNSIPEGYLRFLAGPFDVVFSRQPVHLGPSEDTSIAVSTRIPFLDALKIRMFAGPLTMTWLISTLENRCAEGDPDIGTIPGYDYGDTIILYNIHYFEWSFGRVRAGIGAHYIVSRPYNAFQLGDFFPVFSWHKVL
jgi:hypothetical protein